MMTPAGPVWIALIGATPVVLVLITWSITRQRNHDSSILSRGNATKYISLLKTILTLQLTVQFAAFIFSLLYKLLAIDHYIYIIIFTIQTLTLFKSMLSVSLVVLNSMSLSRAFVKYHVGLLFLLSASVHASVLLDQVSDFSSSTYDFRSFVYLMAVHLVIAMACVALLVVTIYKSFCNKCPNIGCEDGCCCRWRRKTCICLMVVCVICSDVVFLVTSIVSQYPELVPGFTIDQANALLWSQVVEGVLIVILLDPASQCKYRKSQIRLVESPSSSYHLSDSRMYAAGRRAGNQGIKFPITNGSLFASLTAVAMSRGNFLGGFDLKSDEPISHTDTFDKFKTYTKEVDSEETHSVTTVANDDFEFHHHIPPSLANNYNHHVTSKDTPALSLYESASMNDLDSVQSSQLSSTTTNNSQNSNHTGRLYKKNGKFQSHKSDKKIFRRVQSCESLPTTILERSYLDNGGYCEHYDEKVVFVTDFI